jgi:uncharacterized protein DUF6933
MATIFLSAKLLKLIGADRLSAQPSADNLLHQWNAHLFPIFGRKCILVTNKLTLYSFVKLDIFKKDLIELQVYFLISVIRQLITDGFADTEVFYSWRSSFADLNIQRTDNDKRVIGTMNDIIYQLRTAIEYQVPSLRVLTDLTASSYLNNNIYGALKYKSPIEQIASLENCA